MRKIKEFVKHNKFLIFLFLFSFIIRFIVTSFINTPIESDFNVMYKASLELINGTNNYKELPYFIYWAYQMGHVFYQYILLSIINSVTFLKIINCIITSFVVVFIYLISKKIVSNNIAKVVSLLYSLFPFPLLLNTVLTNQHLPILLILISIYILLNIDFNKPLFKSIMIGLLIGISNILRGEGIVIIFSILLYYLILLFKKYSIKKLVLSFVLILVSYYFIFNITSFIFVKSGISDNGLDNKNTYWKFVIGFNYETNGMYSNSDASIYPTNPELSKEIAIERISQLNKIPMLFLKKIKILWFTSDLSWSIGYLGYSIYHKLLNILNYIFIFFINICCFGSLFSLIKNKFNNTQVLISLIILVYFGVYLLIEVMPRYAYSIQVFEFILSAIFIDSVLKKIKH